MKALAAAAGGLVAAALLLAGCSAPPSASDGRFVQEGMASYYAEEFHGRRTSSGEIYNMHEMTAAHRTLPFGSRVRVTNLANGKSLVVRINDRGPFAKDRVIDLSYDAAKDLEVVGSGTARVRLEVLYYAEPKKK